MVKCGERIGKIILKKLSVKELTPFGRLIQEYVDLCEVEGKDPEDFALCENKNLTASLDCLKKGMIPDFYHLCFLMSPLASLKITSLKQSELKVERVWDEEIILKNMSKIPDDLVLLLLRDFIKEFDKNKMFWKACPNGHLELAQWLKQTFPDIDHRAGDDYAFRFACGNGHLELAQWLKQVYPEIDHRARDDYAFRLACKNGHINIVKYLHSICPEFIKKTYKITVNVIDIL